MIAQLRTYTINKGMMDDWLKVFREDIVPLCRSMGIGVESAWVNDEGTQFTWIRTFEDADDIERKEAAMYGSEWWDENVTFVRSHLAHREFTVVNPVVIRIGNGGRFGWPAPIIRYRMINDLIMLR